MLSCVVDNPNQDVPLLAVLMSPIYGFTADDMAALRLENRDIPLYLSLLRAAGEEKRCAQVVSDIARYRAVAATMPSDAFVSFLYGKTGYADLVLSLWRTVKEGCPICISCSVTPGNMGSGYNGISGFQISGPAPAERFRSAGGKTPASRGGTYGADHEHPQVKVLEFWYALGGDYG